MTYHVSFQSSLEGKAVGTMGKEDVNKMYFSVVISQRELGSFSGGVALLEEGRTDPSFCLPHTILPVSSSFWRPSAYTQHAHYSPQVSPSQ